MTNTFFSRKAIRVAAAAGLLSVAVGTAFGQGAAQAATAAPRPAKVVKVKAVKVATPKVKASAVAATADSPLPFEMPSTEALRSSSKKVFAHYLPPFPVSVDNRDPSLDYYKVHYTNPTGESGKHAAYGGFLRDRPIARPKITTGDYIVQDAETEVRQAISAGIDGFTYNVMGLPTDSNKKNWNATKAMFTAANNVDPGFKLVIMPDMMTSPGTKSAADLAGFMAELGKEPAAYRLADGRLVVSPYMANARTAAWWADFMSIMDTTYGLKVALVPTFLDERGFTPSFAGISHGITNWGARNPYVNNPLLNYPSSILGRALAVKKQGKAWMQPVSFQDARPRSGVFDEANNTENLRNSWAIAMASKADWVQMTTWNDYSEGSQMAPTAKNGASVLDLSSYYLTWFKTGTAPTITKDVVYLSSRNQFTTSKPTFAQTRLEKVRAGGSAARNTIETVSFLTAPATVTVKAGAKTYTCTAPAGVSTCTFPLATGTVDATISRSGSAVASVTAARPVTNTPVVQDMEYGLASSGR